MLSLNMQKLKIQQAREYRNKKKTKPVLLYYHSFFFYLSFTV